MPAAPFPRRPGPRVARPARLFALLVRTPVLALMPVLALSALLLTLLWQTHQAEGRRALAQTTRTLALAVEQAVAGTVGRLEVLARSPILASGERAAIDARLAQELAANTDWLELMLADHAGVPIASARTVLEAPLPAQLPDQERAVLHTGRPVVSDLRQAAPGSEASALGVAVALPDTAGGAPAAGMLTVRLDTQALSQLLAAQALRERASASILDGDLRYVARTHDEPAVFGAAAGQDLRRLTASAPAGSARSRDREGEAVALAWQRLSWGWTVAVGVPAAQRQGPLERALGWLALLGAAALAVVLAGAWRSAQRLAGAVDAARVDAERLARGERLAARASPVAELDALYRAQHAAAQRLAALLEHERAARDDAERANRAKDEFLAMLGHELRNPLAALLNGARALGHPALPSAAAAELRALVERQARHLKRLVDDLLDVSRALSGKIRLSRAPLDLAQLVSQVLASLAAAGVTTRHEMRAALERVVVDGDADRLAQVVGNLVTNVAKYAPAGSAIEVLVQAEADGARLTVRDAGRGIEPALLARVFEPFVQGEQTLARAEGGLGVGLTLVRRLTELHGGRVAAASAGPGRGAAFTVWLPRVAPAEPHR